MQWGKQEYFAGDREVFYNDTEGANDTHCICVCHHRDGHIFSGIFDEEESFEHISAELNDRDNGMWDDIFDFNGGYRFIGGVCSGICRGGGR